MKCGGFEILTQLWIVNPDGCERHTFLALILDGFKSCLRESELNSVGLDLASDGFLSDKQVRDQFLADQRFEHTVIDELSARSEKIALQHQKRRQGDEEVPEGELLFIAHVFRPKLRARKMMAPLTGF